MSGHLERLLKSAGQSVPGARPILEVNADHLMIKRFGAESDDDRAREWAEIFYEQALLSEGGRLDDPAGFVRRMNDMIIAMSDAGEATSAVT
jgi:molecular chaperone HtpG